MQLESGMFKEELFKELLQRGAVMIRVLNHPGVVLADTVKLPCSLDYGLSLPIPTTDVSTTFEGIFATLSFDRTPHKTFVPWEAIDAMWAKDYSFTVNWGVEIREALGQAENEKKMREGTAEKPAPKKTTLTLVK